MNITKNGYNIKIQKSFVHSVCVCVYIYIYTYIYMYIYIYIYMKLSKDIYLLLFLLLLEKGSHCIFLADLFTHHVLWIAFPFNPLVQN
jgi:hypothetical protein